MIVRFRHIGALVVTICLSVFLQSCDFIQKSLSSGGETSGEPVARVFESYLYKKDLQNIVPAGTDSLDSISLVKSHIQSWVETQLLVHRAELNLNEQQKNFEKQLEEYKKNLIIYTYEQALIGQNLNTQVSDAEIETYYNNHRSNFELKDYVVLARWVKADIKAPKLKKVFKSLQTKSEKDETFLEDFCYQFASSCQMEKTWMYFNEFTEVVPLKTLNIEDFLRANKVFQIEGEQFVWMVEIEEYKLKDGISPLELEKDKIKNIILNKRKLQLLSEIRKGLMNEGIDKNNVQFYE
jgi:hypothetical protein